MTIDEIRAMAREVAAIKVTPPLTDADISDLREYVWESDLWSADDAEEVTRLLREVSRARALLSALLDALRKCSDTDGEMFSDDDEVFSAYSVDDFQAELRARAKIAGDAAKELAALIGK